MGISEQWILCRCSDSIRGAVKKRNSHLTQYKKEFTFEILRDAIIKHRGNLTDTAKSLKITRKTLYNRMEEFPDLVEVVIEARDIAVDEAEGWLRKKMQKGDTTAIIFFLKTQGKWRGYVERSDNLNINLNLNDLTNDQLSRIANGEDIRSVLSSPGTGALDAPREGSETAGS